MLVRNVFILGGVISATALIGACSLVGTDARAGRGQREVHDELPDEGLVGVLQDRERHGHGEVR